MKEITLPYAKNAKFRVEDLVNYFRTQKINYLIIGATHVTLENHPNLNSLDVWIRNHENVVDHKNVCQAVKEVVKQLIKHEQFSRALRRNPNGGKMCKALVFCDNNK
ncbi:hypothetical protein [Flavobacterium sp.]|jgi:hypothetical protein|uniref:hypothetical protein n=1 Tax=Flavobacterium sp. TaxID=239 RepID=UPI0037BFB931